MCVGDLQDILNTDWKFQGVDDKVSVLGAVVV
jgi:hypothetical protein